MDNPTVFQDKIVLDIGSGTGILSIFAAKAGAKHVYAVENAEIALFSRKIIEYNGLDKAITVIKGKMEEVELPVKEVDIIISEWMGYFLLYEAMLDSVLWARDKYLRKGGLMFPDRCEMYIAAIEDAAYKHEKKSFWDDVYSVDMSCMAPTVMREPLVDYVPSKAILSGPCKILELDLLTMKPRDDEFVCGYQLRMNENEMIHGLVSWWDAMFSNLPNPVELSTAPYLKRTHWKQTVFYSS